MKKLCYPVIFLSLLFSFLSCQSNTEKEKVAEEEPPKLKTYKDARLVQVDSIMIDLIGNFKVYDYHPESDLFLGGDIGDFTIRMGAAPPPSNQIGHVVFNRKGEILHQFINANSGPTGHSRGAHDNVFLGPDEIGVMSKKALYRYGIDGSFRNKYSALNMLDLAGFSDERIVYSVDGRNIVMGQPKGMDAAKRAWDSLYQIVKPLWFYDLDKAADLQPEQSVSALTASYGFPDHPIYAPESEINHSPFPPKMSLDHRTNRLMSVYPEIPEMVVYDIATGEVMERIDLNPDYFECETETGKAYGGVKGYEGLLWLNKGGRMANSSYQEIFQMGDYTLLRYSAALPSSVVSELVSGPRLSQNQDWPRLRRKHYRFYYQLFKDGKKVLPDFEIPELEPQEGQLEMNNNRQTRGKIIGGNGLDEIFVFIPNDGDEERDYELIRVFKLELIEE